MWCLSFANCGVFVGKWVFLLVLVDEEENQKLLIMEIICERYVNFNEDTPAGEIGHLVGFKLDIVTNY
jgi:hypothetical protein